MKPSDRTTYLLGLLLLGLLGGNLLLGLLLLLLDGLLLRHLSCQDEQGKFGHKQFAAATVHTQHLTAHITRTIYYACFILTSMLQLLP